MGDGPPSVYIYVTLRPWPSLLMSFARLIYTSVSLSIVANQQDLPAPHPTPKNITIQAHRLGRPAPVWIYVAWQQNNSGTMLVQMFCYPRRPTWAINPSWKMPFSSQRLEEPCVGSHRAMSGCQDPYSDCPPAPAYKSAHADELFIDMNPFPYKCLWLWQIRTGRHKSLLSSVEDAAWCLEAFRRAMLATCQAW